VPEQVEEFLVIGLAVHIVAPEARPMEGVGAAIDDMVRAVHESRGVSFHLGKTVTAIARSSVTPSVVTGIGCELKWNSNRALVHDHACGSCKPRSAEARIRAAIA
jgi:hypothetical protein